MNARLCLVSVLVSCGGMPLSSARDDDASCTIQLAAAHIIGLIMACCFWMSSLASLYVEHLGINLCYTCLILFLFSCTRNTLDAMIAHQPAIDLVLHAGDLSYADCRQVRLADALEPSPLCCRPVVLCGSILYEDQTSNFFVVSTRKNARLRESGAVFRFICNSYSAVHF